MSSELPDFIALKAHFDSEAFPNGARAELRRVADPEGVAFLPALYRLFPGQRPDERYQRIAFLLPYARHATKAKPLGASWLTPRLRKRECCRLRVAAHRWISSS